MNRNLLRLFMMIVSAGILTSCNEYLDIEPKGKRLLETVDDYDLWLDNQVLHQSAIYELTYLADTRDYPTITDVLDNTSLLAYTWQEELTTTPLESAPIWDDAYSVIYYYNAVVAGVESATGGTDAQRQSLKAEALMGRALLYLDLVNLYGKSYNESTAATDLSVPFVTSVDITDETPGRSTVQQMYEYIIHDLTNALPYLPDDNSSNRFRASIAAGYALLARTYLYMGNYELAAENAQLAMDNGPNVVFEDGTSNIKDIKIRPDAIFSRLGGTGYYASIIPTTDLLQAYDVSDQRLPVHYKNLGDYTFTTRGKTTYSPYGTVTNAKSYPNWGISVSEVRLILAESYARLNQLEVACDQLDSLRNKRFLDDYVRFDSDDQEEVIQKVLLERLLEFPFNGLRWFDMRRLAAEGRMPTVNRYYASGDVIATLPPDGNRYVLKIPDLVLSYNEDWEQNP